LVPLQRTCLSYAAPLGRAGDVIGMAMSLEHVSDSRRALTRDFRSVTGLAAPMPDFESALEISWQAQVGACWIVQPDLQWIIHPGGRVLDPAHPLAITPDALVLGLRTAVAL
jgi:porin